MSSSLFDDWRYQICISVAAHSKSKREKYGSIIFSGDELVGMGFNRAVRHKHVHLERPLVQGYANHAEIEAINDALMTGRDVSGGVLYVAGFFAETGEVEKPGHLIVWDEPLFTCVRCANEMRRQGVSYVVVPTYDGWVPLSMEDAQSCAQQFSGGTLEKRTAALTGEVKISDISAVLPDIRLL